jgi:hypothetical protein
MLYLWSFNGIAMSLIGRPTGSNQPIFPRARVLSAVAEPCHSAGVVASGSGWCERFAILRAQSIGGPAMHRKSILQTGDFHRSCSRRPRRFFSSPQPWAFSGRYRRRERFLVAMRASQSGPRQLTIVLNWQAALKKSDVLFSSSVRVLGHSYKATVDHLP